MLIHRDDVFVLQYLLGQRGLTDSMKRILTPKIIISIYGIYAQLDYYWVAMHKTDPFYCDCFPKYEVTSA